MAKFLINVLLTIVVAACAAFLFWRFAPLPLDVLQLVGLLLFLVGFTLWTVARFQLGAALTVTAQARQLVNRGLYAKIRNPIYVFGSTLIAGLVLLLHRPLWLLILVALAPLQVWRARTEAKLLESSFGDQYRLYRESTWF